MSGSLPASDPRRVQAPFGRREVPVIRNEQLGEHYRLLWVEDRDSPAPAPGQFAMIAAATRWGAGADERPYLSRAFSIARRTADGEAAFMLERVGPGSERLAELQPGDRLAVLGPLGRGFAPTPDANRLILVGGGVGIAPLAILQDQLPERCVALLGFRDRAHAEGAALLRDPALATDDGSAGHHGPVTDLLERELDACESAKARPLVCSCGPPGMLEAVRAICERRDVPAELALEAPMACGFGSCYGCALPLRAGGYLRVCLDGPVVDASLLERVA